jgi:aspartate-semialdehyde dehydrogenase
VVAKNYADFVTPSEIWQKENVSIGRLRAEPSNPKGLWLWMVADNLWVGAALNAVRIAQFLASSKYP